MRVDTEAIVNTLNITGSDQLYLVEKRAKRLGLIVSPSYSGDEGQDGFYIYKDRYACGDDFKIVVYAKGGNRLANINRVDVFEYSNSFSTEKTTLYKRHWWS